MKKGKKRKSIRKKPKQIRAFDIKQTLIFRVLIFCVIILIILIVIYIFVYEPKLKEKELEEGLGGELGTLCIFCSDNPVVLSVLNYTISSNNLTVNVNINWSAGNISRLDFNFTRILVDFDMRVGNNCNYTISSGLPNFGNNLTYTLNYNFGDLNLHCSESDFSNVTNVLAYAEVNIHLIQKGLIPNINFYKDSSRNNLIYLNNYFYALTEINYSIVESPSNNQIEVVVNNLTKNISISTLDDTWFGTQTFNLTASTKDGDNLTTAFSIIVINDTIPVLNHEPIFNEDECGEFSWNKNTNKTIDMDSCWSDEDGNNLNYEYSELNNYQENISILNLSGNRLRFVPNIGFNGSTYLFFYANDSHVRVSHRVNLYILGNNTSSPTPTPTPTPTPAPDILELKSSNPAGLQVSFFVNETKRFSIIAENYENVEWYVDNVLVKEGVLSYIFEEKKPGVYSIKVRIINGTFVENKVWEVTIEEDEYIEQRIFDVDTGQVIFYAIIVVLSIIIILVIWLLIIGIKGRNRKMDLGFGVSVVPNRNGVNESSRQFNIPKD
jgi:hypothetical protein